MRFSTTHKTLLFAALCLFIFCIPKNKLQSTTTKTETAKTDTIKYYMNDSVSEFIKLSAIDTNKKINVFYNFLAYFNVLADSSFSKNDIGSLQYTYPFAFRNSTDSFELFLLVLKNVPSNVWSTEYSILVNINKSTFCVLPIADGEAINLAGDDKHIISGISKHRGVGYCRFYNLIDNKMKKVFETGHIVFNESSSCVIFQPFQLVKVYEDVNKDGFDDIVYKGNYLDFCEGYESGPNYCDGDSIKSHGPLRYVYIYKPNSPTLFYFDSLKSKTYKILEDNENPKSQTNYELIHKYNLNIQPLAKKSPKLSITIERRDTAQQADFKINRWNNTSIYIKGHFYNSVGDMSFTLTDSANKYTIKGRFIYGEDERGCWMAFDENGNEVIIPPTLRADSIWTYTAFDGKFLATRKYKNTK